MFGMDRTKIQGDEILSPDEIPPDVIVSPTRDAPSVSLRTVAHQKVASAGRERRP